MVPGLFPKVVTNFLLYVGDSLGQMVETWTGLRSDSEKKDPK